MDCKDLMIGDWVSYLGFYNKVIYIGQKVSIYNGKGTEFTTDPEHIRPIPLTEDILVKNGFSYEEDTFLPDTGYWSLSDEDGLLYLTINAFGVKGSGEVAFGYQDIALNYVHQLQHLLRLCGIEKEIEL